jgi:hypothetical protein
VADHFADETGQKIFLPFYFSKVTKSRIFNKIKSLKNESESEKGPQGKEEKPEGEEKELEPEPPSQSWKKRSKSGSVS